VPYASPIPSFRHSKKYEARSTNIKDGDPQFSSLFSCFLLLQVKKIVDYYPTIFWLCTLRDRKVDKYYWAKARQWAPIPVTKAEVGKSAAIILLGKFNLHYWRFNFTASRRNCIGLWSITLYSLEQFVFWFVGYRWHIQISVLQSYTLHSVKVTRGYHSIPWRMLNFFSQVQSLRTRRYHIDTGCSWIKFPDARNVKYSPCQKSRKRRKKEN
jgi:hypothetical protein